MKYTKTLPTLCAALAAVFGSACEQTQQTKQPEIVDANVPFDMPAIVPPTFPDRDFPITDFGAKEGENADNTKAFAAAIDACNKAGGGRVVVPAGLWKTGAIHFKSNVNLYLSENSEVRFSGDPQKYLPAVQSSWEGLECFNYSPLVYAFECENVAITGSGTLRAEMGTWLKWMNRPQAHMDALRKLYDMGSTDVPVEKRQMAVGENHLRPQFLQFNRCKNILLDGFKIRESPFWTIHIFKSQNGVLRNLDVKALSHNNDGVDFEMSKNFLVENCKFCQGDDAIVIKSGRNRDGWRLTTPSENIVARNNTVEAGHGLLVIGSELSGGVRNVYVENCEMKNNPIAPSICVLTVKTNYRRGGFVENVRMKNIKAENVKRAVLYLDMTVFYQWKNFPDYEKRLTKIDGITLENITCAESECAYKVIGDADLQPRNVVLKDVKIGKITKFLRQKVNCDDLKVENLTYGELTGPIDRPAKK